MASPALIWADIRDKARRHGWLRALPFALHRLTWIDVIHYEHLYVLSRPILPTGPDAPLDIPITFRLATADDLPRLCDMYWHPSELAALGGAFQRGDMIALALHEGRLIGHHLASFWFGVSSPPEIFAVEIARRFPVTDQDVYTHNLVVLPAYRGKRLAVPLGAYLMRALYERGYRRIFSVVKTDNAPSLRAVRRMGGHVIGRMISIRLPGWWYVRVTSVGDEPLADKNCGARAG